MDRKMMNVYETDNYKKFKKLLDNREVKPQRIKSIIESIQRVGYIVSPLTVNEKFEVIDGQGRLAAAESLSLPVYYIVVPGIGINECRAMNLHQSNWTVKDFIDSYAKSGNLDYIHLRNLLTEYDKKLGVNAIYSLVSGAGYSAGGKIMDKIRNGKLTFTQKEYEKARKMCAYMDEFTSIFSRFGGRKDIYYGAVRFMLTVEGCDKEALKTRAFRRQATIIPAATTEQAVACLEDCYNYRAAKKIYFTAEYRKWADDKEKEKRKTRTEREKTSV